MGFSFFESPNFATQTGNVVSEGAILPLAGRIANRNFTAENIWVALAAARLMGPSLRKGRPPPECCPADGNFVART